MSQQSRDTDADSASVLSASSAASYHRRKKAKEQPNIQHFQAPMSVSDYSDFSRYPRSAPKTVEREGPGIRMRGTTTKYDDNALPAGYNAVTKATTYREDDTSHSRRPRHRRSSSSTSPSPRIRHEVRSVPHPTAPGGVAPHVVTHVHLSPSPRRNRRHRSASREPPPVASRPAYGRRRSRSYDDGYKSRTTIINVPPPPIAPIAPNMNPGYMYSPPPPVLPLRPLPAAPEFGYGRPAAGASSGYGGSPPFVPPAPTSVTVMQQPSAPGPSPAMMAASASGSPSRRRAMSNAYAPSSPASMSPYGSASPTVARGGQYPAYGPSQAPYSASAYGAPASRSQVYPPQSGYGAPMQGTAPASVVINVPPQGGTMAGSGRARAMSMNGMGYPGTGMGGSPYSNGGGGGGYGAGGRGGGGVGGAYGERTGAHSERNPYGAGNIGYGQSANGVYGYGPGQARDPTPHGSAPSPPYSQMPPGTGFFGGLFGGGRKSPKSETSGNEDPYARDYEYEWQMRRGGYN